MSEAEENVETLRSVVEGANQFSSSFFQTVVKHNPGNLITSPLSEAIVLAMIAFGARENTEAQFRNVLHLPTSQSLATSGYQSLVDYLKNVRYNKLAVGYKPFFSKGLGLKGSYKDLIEVYFRSNTSTLNFAENTETANLINAWAELNTDHAIKELITADMLNDATKLVLVNAVYFKGQWKKRFDSDLTRDKPFHISKVEVKNVPTMYAYGYYKYGELPDLNARFVVIPYEGGELSMVIILPNEIDGLSDVEKKLQNTNLTNILSQGYEALLKLWLPKFKVESMLELNDVLKEMGLTDAFTSRANFSGIADKNLYINDVLQKACIKVNEEGSDYSPIIEMEIEALLFPSLEEFRVNGPLFYAITSRDDNVVLFKGHVIDCETTA